MRKQGITRDDKQLDGKVKEVATMLKAIHAQENIEEARRKKSMVVDKLTEMKLGKAADIVNLGCEETFSFYAFPVEHWKRIRTNNGLERIMKEIRRRTRVVGITSIIFRTFISSPRSSDLTHDANESILFSNAIFKYFLELQFDEAT